MPHLFPFASHTTDDVLQEMGSGDAPYKRLRRHSRLKNPFDLLRRHRSPQPITAETVLPQTAPTELKNIPEYFARRTSFPDDVPTIRRAIPSLPRPQTFRRQKSEQRVRLLEVKPTHDERRTLSVDRRQTRGLSERHLSPRPIALPFISAPSVSNVASCDPVPSDTQPTVDNSASQSNRNLADLPPLLIPENVDENPIIDEDGIDREDDIDKTSLQEEYDRCWILNLSMHFRDKSNREKFFVTYAEKKNQWRRITVSLDYRNAPEDSLEADLSTLCYQRDKSMRIYEAIRDSLPEIQYYDTVTNLKLETTRDDGQLHVHVREDANEIINYPAVSLFDHIRCPRFNESTIEFDSHLSGFVYKVRLLDRVVIKKEIPGPDTVDEFLYEVNALDSLLGSKNVVQLEGLVTDDRGEHVKGLLISYASKGALVDMIYDFRGSHGLPWHRREKWAKQIVSGLADIHEAGFVQGDFTLSNIVIDEDDNAQIIDINRRGCPVGWEPPELGKLIDNGQRISMCIGVKTDIFQLGMVLWALAEEVDEPERVERPLPDVYDEIPDYYSKMVKTCLSERPQERKSAVQLLQWFPTTTGQPPSRRISFASQRDMQLSDLSDSTTGHRSKEYIDPDMAVTIDDVREGRRMPEDRALESAVTYVGVDSNPASTTYQFESSGSWVIGRRRPSRGRSPISSRRRRSSPYPYDARTMSSATSISQASPGRRPDSAGQEGDKLAVERHAPGPKYSRGHPTLSEAGSTLDGASTSTALDKRVAALQIRGATGKGNELLHIDSGFDETMIEEIERGESKFSEPSTKVEDPPVTPTRVSTSSQEPPTPDSFYTPGATPNAYTYEENANEDIEETRDADDGRKRTNVMINDRFGACMPVTQDGTSALESIGSDLQR